MDPDPDQDSGVFWIRIRIFKHDYYESGLWIRIRMDPHSFKLELDLDLDLDPDPDPHSEKLLDPDPDPHKMNGDPQPCYDYDDYDYKEYHYDDYTDLIFVPVSPTGRVVVFSLTRGSSGDEKLSCRPAFTTVLSGASAGPRRGVISTLGQGTRGTDAPAT